MYYRVSHFLEFENYIVLNVAQQIFCHTVLFPVHLINNYYNTIVRKTRNFYSRFLFFLITWFTYRVLNWWCEYEMTYVHWGVDLQVLEYIDIYLGFFGRICSILMILCKLCFLWAERSVLFLSELVVEWSKIPT